MEISIKGIALFSSVLFTGLSAGLFYGWSVSVIPGNQQVNHATYLETMQSINRAILNPAFFAVFFGSIVLLSVASFMQLDENNLAFGLMLAAAITYLLGTIAVTGLGNVPLNNELEALDLSELGEAKIAEFRKHYETRWNRFHQIRMAGSIASFALAILSLLSSSKA